MRARMRSPCCICTCCLDVYAADDPLGDVRLHVGFFLLARLIPLLQSGLGGIANWPLRRRCRTPGACGDQSEGLEKRALSLGRDYIDRAYVSMINNHADVSAQVWKRLAADEPLGRGLQCQSAPLASW